MKKFKVIVLRSQYQTVIVDAEDHEHAETIAIDTFDPERLFDQEFIEAYDVETLQKPKTWRR